MKIEKQRCFQIMIHSNLTLFVAKEGEVKHAVFLKKRSLSVLNMAKSNWIYRKLTNFPEGHQLLITLASTHLKED